MPKEATLLPWRTDGPGSMSSSCPPLMLSVHPLFSIIFLTAMPMEEVRCLLEAPKIRVKSLVASRPFTTFYHWNMTRDAGSMTVELRAKNPLRRGGIVYAQRYNIVKELWDAQGTYPFTSKALEGLLVPDSLSHLWQTVGGAPNTWTPRHSWQIYEASKERVRHSMMGAEPNTFGVREEYRITWDLFISLDVLKHWPSKIDICPLPTKHLGNSSVCPMAVESLAKLHGISTAS